MRDDCLEEDRADVPKNKEGANFCEYFHPQVGVFSDEQTDKAASARSELDALFAKKKQNDLIKPLQLIVLIEIFYQN